MTRKRKLLKVARMLAEVDAARRPPASAFGGARTGTLAVNGGYAALSPQPPLSARAR
jgi:hypothetical protein